MLDIKDSRIAQAKRGEDAQGRGECQGGIVPAAVAYKEFLCLIVSWVPEALSRVSLKIHNLIDISPPIIKELRSRVALGHDQLATSLPSCILPLCTVVHAGKTGRRSSCLHLGSHVWHQRIKHQGWSCGHPKGNQRN